MDKLNLRMMKRNIRKTFILFFFFLIIGISGYSQNTVIHDIPWRSDTVGIWGPGSTPWSINQVDTLFNLSIGPYGNTYSYVFNLPWPISDSVGVIFDYGAYFNAQLIFEMTGWASGLAKVNYPTKIEMDFPANSSFTNGSWVTIPSEYREQDTIVHPADTANWDIYAEWPDVGKIELYLNLDIQANADLIYSDPTDIFNIVWDTLSFFPPININLDTFDIFLIDIPNGEYTIPWVAYHTDPITGNLVIDSVYFLHDSLGMPIVFPAIFYNLIGISGDISIPDITTYTKWIENEQRLYTWGKDEYLHINLDIVKFVQMICQYTGLTQVSQALSYLQGSYSYTLFTDPFSGEPFAVSFVWDILDLSLLFTNTMNQTLSFEDNKEYTFFGIPIPPDHYPNVWNVFKFPVAVDYNVLDTLGAVIESGTADSVKFCADYDLQLRFPCYSYDSLPVTISHTIDPWLTNMIRDTISVDLGIKVLDISYSIGTPSNIIFSGNYVLYQDTLQLGSFAGPPLYGPPLFMPWLIIGDFQDTTFIPDEYLVPVNQPLGDTILVTNVVCFGTNTGSVQVIASGGTPPYTYSWSDSTNTIISTSDTIHNLGAETYYVSVTDANGCTVTDSAIIIQYPLIVDAGHPQSICAGDSVNLGGSPTAWDGCPQYYYSWTSNPGTFTSNTSNPSVVNLTVTTTYTVIVTDDNSNSASDDIVITVNPLPTAIAGSDDTICDGFTTNLNASGGIIYSWSPVTDLSNPNISNPVADPSATTTYTVTVTDANGCSNTDDITVTVLITPVADAGPDQTICFGDTAVLTASGGDSYVWSTGDVTATILCIPSDTTTYIVTVYYKNGCSSSDDITINVNPIPDVTLINDWGDNPIHSEQLITFTANPDGYNNYEFFIDNNSVQSGSGNVFSTSTLENGQVVSVIATNNGCPGIDSIVMIVKPIPNAFSPNGDSKNDVFLKGMDIIILNRWGQQLYQGIDGWDGTYNGERVAPGTYFYILHFNDNSKTPLTGTVTLLRKDK